MDIHVSAENGEGKVGLRGEITIYDAQQCKQLLLDALKNNKIIHLDFSEVVEIDTAGIQILVAFLRSAKIQHRNVKFHAVGSGVIEVIRLCNLEAELGLPST